MRPAGDLAAAAARWRSTAPVGVAETTAATMVRVVAGSGGSGGVPGGGGGGESGRRLRRARRDARAACPRSILRQLSSAARVHLLSLRGGGGAVGGRRGAGGGRQISARWPRGLRAHWAPRRLPPPPPPPNAAAAMQDSVGGAASAAVGPRAAALTPNRSPAAPALSPHLAATRAQIRDQPRSTGERAGVSAPGGEGGRCGAARSLAARQPPPLSRGLERPCPAAPATIDAHVTTRSRRSAPQAKVEEGEGGRMAGGRACGLQPLTSSHPQCRTAWPRPPKPLGARRAPPWPSPSSRSRASRRARGRPPP